MPDTRRNCPLPGTYIAEQEIERRATLGKEAFVALLTNDNPDEEVKAPAATNGAIASNTEYVESPDESPKAFDTVVTAAEKDATLEEPTPPHYHMWKSQRPRTPAVKRNPKSQTNLC